MLRKLALFSMLLALFVVSTTAHQENDPDKDIKATMDAYRAAKTDEEKVNLWFDFLDRNPDNKYTEGTINYLVSVYFLEHLKDPDKAIEFINESLEKIKTPENRLSVKRLAIDVYGKAGKVDKLRALAAELSEGRELSYNEHLSIAQAAVEAGAWELALEHIDFSFSSATPEAVKADYPNRNFTEEELADIAKWRKGDSLTYQGWILVNLDRFEEAHSHFEQAEDSVSINYLGIPENELYLYWAKALLKQGDYKGAMEKIALDAVFGWRDEALPVLQEAYSKTNGRIAGFEDYIWDLRLKLARPVDDFALPDYDGKSHRFSDLKGKVTLLSFWFPT